MPATRPRPAKALAWIFSMAFVLAPSDALHAQAPAPVDFERDVWPIFKANCVRCHGPKKRQGGFAIDNKRAALAGGDGGAAIVPGQSERSRLYRYVAGLDDETIMPPDGDELTAEQAATIKTWIDQGAAWPDANGASAPAAPRSDHWSFQKPVRPAPPAVKDVSWPRGAIDRFVLARLEKEGLAPSPEAGRATLIRRLSLDLTGLPPTIAEVDAFVADKRPDAYEQLADRLLASPQYGERWARFWLDRARYADTNGYEKDRDRSIWPYRDWVIRAWNADMPFDRFTIEQIAGDLLPGATLDQRVATGFHRNTMVNEEGGIDVEEFRFAALVDRVATTGAVWLGLTVGCAQCHTHKYDPITQREYYEFMAFLDNADEPELEVPSPALERQRAAALAEIEALEASRASKLGDLEAKQAAWEASLHPTRWSVLTPRRLASLKHATMTTMPDGSVLVSGDKPNNDVYTVELMTDLADVTALRLEVLPDPSLPDGGPGRAPLFSVGDFLLTELTVDAGRDELTKAALTDASQDYCEPNRTASLAIDGVSDTGWAVKGGVGRAHRAVFTFRDVLAGGPGTRLAVTMRQEYIHQMTIGRFRLSVTSDPRPVRASELPAEAEAALLVPRVRRDDSQRLAVRNHFLSVAPELTALNQEIEKRRASLPRYPTTLVMRERAPEHARVTRIHKRGEFLKAADPVQPGVPGVLHPLPSDAPKDRLTFARWLVAGDNPLVGRVLMNQVWQAYFGQGLVTTPLDFGTQGERPSHPELLDWLAVELPSRGWSMKAMHRLIVTSAAYRQDSKASPSLLARDPRNVLLARGPRFRVDAEMVRDIALAASGLLELQIGGPSVYPPQPEGATSLAYGAPSWKTSAGPDRYRRGLYTFLKRTAPYASFIVMDAPTSDTVCVRRERSNTPLQALALLNDAVFVEAAQAMARRVVSEGGATPESRAAYAFRLALSRPPAPDELRQITAFHARQRERFRSGELDARAVAGLDAKAGDAVDLAAWTTVARSILNLDETITKE